MANTANLTPYATGSTDLIFKKNDNNTTIDPLPAAQEFIFTARGLSDFGGLLITDITSITEDNKKKIKVQKGNGTSTNVEVGSNVAIPNDTSTSPQGTTPIEVDGITINFPIKGLSSITTNHVTTTYIGSSGSPWTNGYITNLYGTGNIGLSNAPFTNAYITNLYGTNLGSSSSPFTNAYITNLTLGGSISSSGKLSISDTSDGITGTTRNSSSPHTTTLPNGTITGNTNASIYTQGGIYAVNNIYGERMFNAVFNDYAEYRTTINLTPGHVVVDQDNGSLACSTARLQPGAQVISDTFGHAMGQTFKATTPIAVAGRVLVYPYQAREKYHAGMAVCSAPDGTVDIMTREEIKEYPDCIVGIVSEIPQYETWGSNNIKVDGRIWIKI